MGLWACLRLALLVRLFSCTALARRRSPRGRSSPCVAAPLERPGDSRMVRQGIRRARGGPVAPSAAAQSRRTDLSCRATPRRLGWLSVWAGGAPVLDAARFSPLLPPFSHSHPHHLSLSLSLFALLSFCVCWPLPLLFVIADGLLFSSLCRSCCARLPPWRRRRRQRRLRPLLRLWDSSRTRSTSVASPNTRARRTSRAASARLEISSTSNSSEFFAQSRPALLATCTSC